MPPFQNPAILMLRALAFLEVLAVAGVLALLLTGCASNPPPHDDWAKLSVAVGQRIGK